MKIAKQDFNLSSFLLGALVILGLMLTINATPHDPSSGRYQTISSESTIIVTDTETGELIIRYAGRKHWEKVRFKEQMMRP